MPWFLKRVSPSMFCLLRSFSLFFVLSHIVIFAVLRSPGP